MSSEKKQHLKGNADMTISLTKFPVITFIQFILRQGKSFLFKTIPEIQDKLICAKALPDHSAIYI